ncbi:hypothetical protein BKH41_08740 [Helicobacter sp. 12S02232-10]|uniref:prepilin peptidase n=1 Tax=Helicobacter sp. 12S02232-10 TaxID=1476197 RepID=UPI000BDD1B1D|nr:prepilin peptidase [Helicobacter sp. 12S02232-10]PAF46731.1 hypothetical protein BKH41_08740 [Helicobacter sp. 12S02232-10]
MESDLLIFEGNNLLYFFLSPNSLDMTVLAVIILGWGIFGITRFDKHCRDVFDLMSFCVFVLALLLFLGLGVGFFYQGIFRFWAMAVFSLMLLLALVDLKKLAVPDWMNFGLFFIVIFGVVFFEGNGALFVNKLLDGFGLAGLFAVLRIFGDMIFKREVLGEGDIVFIASSGFLFGINDALSGIFVGCVFASAWGLFLRLFSKKIVKIPLITFIVLGLFFGFFLEVYNG